MSEWIKVVDRLPEKDGNSTIWCLVFTKRNGVCVHPFNEYHDCWDDSDGDDYFTPSTGGDVTHWQPLPDPPKN